jgi:hypothetical protein
MTSPHTLVVSEEAREIAAKLTEAQRTTLYSLTQVPRRSKLSCAALMALYRKGLAHKGWSSFNGNVWSITPRGLEVRAALRLTQGDNL